MMNRIGISIALLMGLVASATQAKTRPNVLVIYTDDHRYTGVHALGKQALANRPMANQAWRTKRTARLGYVRPVGSAAGQLAGWPAAQQTGRGPASTLASGI